ncbi:MAG: hypothetical protein JSR93_04750 [Verrucomicrobia bacterium]|nr:hypothetical protein [Verrucomicrobiota bacterium]
MATHFDPSQQTTGLPSGSPLYPQFPGISSLFTQDDLQQRPPAINPQFNPSATHRDPPPSFGSTVSSTYPLTLASELHYPLFIRSTCDGSSPSYAPVYPKVPVLYSSFQFKESHSLIHLPTVVPGEFIAKEPALSSQLLGQIDQLNRMDFDGFHPWQLDEEQRPHALIGKIMNELTAKFPKEATLDAFQYELALCEKAIFEIEQLPTIDSEYKAVLEIGIRDALSKYIEVFEANKVGNIYEKTKAIPSYIQDIPTLLNQFATRATYYKSSSFFHHGGELLTWVRYHFNMALTESFKQQNMESLSLQQQFELCKTLINLHLQVFDATPTVQGNLQFDGHQTMTSMLLHHYVPLFKQAYEAGKPLPCDLHQLLDGLYNLASDHNTLLVEKDPRQTFVQSVFGVDDIAQLRSQIAQTALAEKALIDSTTTPTAQPAKSFWSKINIFSKEPSAEQLAREASQRKAAAYSAVDAKQQAQNLVIDQLAAYMSSGHPLPVQPLLLDPTLLPSDMKPSAPPMDDAEQLYPVIVTPHVGDKTVTGLSTLPLAQAANPTKVTISFAAQPKKTKPTGSYVHLAFRDLLERTAEDKDLFGQFPKPVQRDLMRHLFHTRNVGPAEARIEAAFKKNVDGRKVPHVNHLYTRELAQLDKQLKTTSRTSEQQLGEDLLSLYYQGKQNDDAFTEKLNTFPTSELFLYYVWDIAKNASVEIPDTEDNWAGKNYKNPQFVHLTMQALERFLHTP